MTNIEYFYSTQSLLNSKPWLTSVWYGKKSGFACDSEGVKIIGILVKTVWELRHEKISYSQSSSI